MRKLKGMGLLEIFLVLAVSATVILFATRQYARFNWNAQRETIKQSVNYLFQGLDLYYYANCQISGFNNLVTYTNVVNMLEPNVRNLIQNPWNNSAQPYDVAIVGFTSNNTNKESYYVQVSTTLTGQRSNIMPSIAQSLGAVISGNRITWRRLPINQIPKISTNTWILRGELLQFGHLVVANGYEPACPV